ncbi:MAG: PAS domain-containing sensor histidine kinase [Chloroflexi bacterium]|nr:MAG: PAS domain-containing sensor histidine kinase [Chloroflexota bacterium]
MKKPSNPSDNWDNMRNKIIGLGERSLRKSYYPELLRQLEATRQSEELFRLLADNTHDGVLIIEENIIKYANSRLAEILGDSHDDLSKNAMVSILIAQINTDFSHHGNPTITEFWITRPDKNKRFLHVRHFHLQVAERPVRLYIMVTDLTAHKRREEDLERRVHERTSELQKAYQKLKELDQLKNDFISNVSHDLRTPLTNIQLYARLLELNKKPKKQAHYWQVLNAESARLETLIEDLLVLSSLEHSRFPQNIEKTNIHQLIAQELKALQARIKSKCVVVKHQPPSNLPSLLIEPHRIKQVFTNLLANALTYTIEGGNVCISYTAVSLQNKPAVCIKIQNDGPSIMPTDLPHLFERFYRGENALATKSHGSGLGLAICQQIIEQHYGKITINSNESDGTIVAVCLPLSQN